MSEEFEHIVGTNYSAAEAHMGQDAYRSTVKYNEAQTVILGHQAKIVEEQAKQCSETVASANRKDNGKAVFYYALGLLFFAVTVILAFVAIPTVVIVWRSAF